jgi:hypothetical protein
VTCTDHKITSRTLLPDGVPPEKIQALRGEDPLRHREPSRSVQSRSRSCVEVTDRPVQCCGPSALSYRAPTDDSHLMFGARSAPTLIISIQYRKYYTTTGNLCTGGPVSLYTGGSRNRLWCTDCDVKQHHMRSITNRL